MARQKSFTVHLPPSAPGKDPDAKVEVIADAFQPIAFVAPWLYFILNRMWLEALAAILVIAAAFGLAWAVGTPPIVNNLIGIAAGLLIGLEAVSLRRWSLKRRGYVEAGVLVAATQEEAERRYFAERGSTVRPAPPAAAPAPSTGGGSVPVIGLFPTPDGAPRGFR